MTTERFELGRARLTPKGRKWHATGHPWVYRDDVAEVAEGRGYLLAVDDDLGRRRGIATFSPRSRIALRFVLWGDGDIPDRETFLRERIAAAWRRRAPLADETDACRVVSSEADGLPGLIVDRYADVLVLQSLTPFVETHLDHIVPALVDLLAPRMVLARNDVRVREWEGLPEAIDLCHGQRVERVRIHEHGLELEVDPFHGQKTGFFLDQRPARALVERLARARGGRVLDLFSYTGGFALHAARGGAQEVVMVDSSEAALQEGQAAAARNRLAGVQTLRGKAAQVLRDLAARGERFDGIVLDPPAFAKSRADLTSASRGYADLNYRAMQLLAPGGWLVTCSCSYNLRPGMFLDLIAGAAARAGCRFLDHGRLPPALDHPVLLSLPESDYLKVHWLEAL